MSVLLHLEHIRFRSAVRHPRGTRDLHVPRLDAQWMQQAEHHQVLERLTKLTNAAPSDSAMKRQIDQILKVVTEQRSWPPARASLSRVTFSLSTQENLAPPEQP
jgi:hypothetical protein